MTPLVWKDGQLVEGTMAEFTAQLRRFAGLCAREFSTRSDPIGLVSERIDMAADLLDAHATSLRDGNT